MKPTLAFTLLLPMLAGCAAAGAPLQPPSMPSFDVNCTNACAAWWTQPDHSDQDATAVRCECRSRPTATASAWSKAR